MFLGTLYGQPTGRPAEYQPRGCARGAAGFSLLELLVVIALLFVLLTLLLPQSTRALSMARRTYCLGNLRQLQMAHTVYAAEHDGIMPGALTGADCWAMYTGDDSYESQYFGVTNGVLWPYVKSIKTYICPDHPVKTYLRCYSINNYLNGDGWGYPSPRRRVGEVARPAVTISFIEDPDPRKGLMDSWVTDTANFNNWVDQPGWWHDLGATYAFADGHAEYWRWQDARTLMVGYAFFASTPNNPDLRRVDMHVCPGDRQSPFKALGEP